MPDRKVREADPRELHQKPPFEEPPQRPPGLESEMRNRPDHSEHTYQGYGRLRGKTIPTTMTSDRVKKFGKDTAIPKHERRKKARHGLRGELRGKQASAADAAGAAMGSFGLAAFGCIAWWWIPSMAPVLALAAALVAWFVVACLIWAVWKYHHRWTT